MTRSVLMLALVACQGVGGQGGKDQDGSGKDAALTGECGAPCGELPITQRFARLTNPQWENTAQDLLHLPAPPGLAETFIGDPLSEGFENDAENLQISPELWQDYQRAAETLAAQVVADPALYAAVVPEDPRTGGGGGGGTFSQTLEGEDPSLAATTGAAQATDYNLWSNGSLTATFDLPDSAAYTFTVRVWAEQGGPDLAQMTVGVDGVQQLATAVTADSSATAEEFEVQASLDAGVHTVTVSFLNDYWEMGVADRNLHIDWIAVEGGTGGGSGGLGTSTAGPAERDAWIRSFGQRAHRRPLTDADVTAYAGLFDQGPTLFGTGDDFADGVQLVLTAMLQSPWFLYRVEDSGEVQGGRIALSSWELASKLSYALWNTMPDEALFAAADSGALATDAELEAQAERMMADERAHAMVADFHRQLLLLDNYENITKDPTLYPEFGPTTAASMQAEAQAYVEDVVFGGGGVHALMTTPRSYVNEDLAKIYGIPGITGDELVPVDLNPAERAGLLTLAGFLALEGDAYVQSPIRRGVFANLQILCAPLPPPPDVIPPLPPLDGSMTMREQVEAFTGDGTCGAGCHSTMINPIGFAYEHYDALGRYRTEEFGQPVNSSDSYGFKGGTASYDDAIDLAGILGDDPGVHQCYVGHWLEYLQGRHREDSDDGLVEWLGEGSRLADVPITDLLVDLVLSDSFRFRNPEVQ